MSTDNHKTETVVSIDKAGENGTNADPVAIFADRFLQTPWRFPDKHDMQPTLSLALIVKGTKDSVVCCLDSVGEAVDEIIIIDTGPADQTHEVAKSYGAKIFHGNLNTDLSGAINMALDRATCDWIMLLGTDDELVKEDVENLRELLHDNEHEGFFFNEFNFVGEDKESDSIVTRLAFRLWRNRSEYRYSEVTNEQIIDKVRSRNPNIGFSNIRINHYSYFNENMGDDEKAGRNSNLLLEEVEKKPEDPFLRFNLGVEYVKNKEYESALDQYKEAFANISGLDLAYAPKLVRNIAICLKELGRNREAIKVLSDAKDTYPNYTDLFYIEGLTYMAEKDFIAAAESFMKCLEMGPASSVYASQPGVGGYLAAYMLARAYLSIGNEKEVVASYKKALEYNPAYCSALLELGLMLVNREDPDELKRFLESLVDLSSEGVILSLALIFSQGGYYNVSLDYLDKIADNSVHRSQVALLRGECLFNLKRYREAVAEFNNVSDSSQYYPAASADKAMCFLLLHDYDEAVEAIDVIKHNQEFKLVYSVYRSLINLLSGDLVSISVKKEHREEAHRIIADVLGKLLDLREFDIFEEATKLLSHFDFTAGEISLFLGKIYYDAGFNEMAVEELIKAHEGGHADGEAFFILGRTALGNEFYEEAKTFFFEALNRGIEELTLYIPLGRTLMKLGEVDQAVEILDMGAKKYPNSTLLSELKQSISEVLIRQI